MSCGSFCSLAIRWSLPLVLIGLIHESSPGQETDNEQIVRRFRKEMIEISPGTAAFKSSFSYGQLGDEAGTVTRAPEPFLIGQYEVPQNLWQAIMNQNPSRWKGPRNSVEMVSVANAIQFCERLTTELRELNLITQQQIVRLPTELEWEYAARAGTDTEYSFGNDVERLDDYGWHTGNAAGNDPPVGAKKPTTWKLYDVHGYLSEYCLPTQATQTQPQWNRDTWGREFTEGNIAIRGGSWKDRASSLRSGYRTTVPLTTEDDAIGLRCVIAGPLKPHPVAGFQPTAQATMVDKKAKVEWIWNDGEFTEGPAVDSKSHIYFSDIGNRILVLEPETGTVKVAEANSGRSNGLMFRRDGMLVRCEGANTGGGRRISIGKPGTSPKTLAADFEGQRFNSPNDLVIDTQGRIYFSDPRYVGDQPRELDEELVFLIDANGQTTVATAEVTKPNGVILSPDGNRAYVADHAPSGPKQLLRFSVQESGALTQKEMIFDFGASRGIDGMTVDQQGNVYATAGSGLESGIYVFGPEGEHLAFIPTPGAPTNCVFGNGKQAATLYITGEGPAPEQGDETRAYGIGKIHLKHLGYHVTD